MVNVKRGIVAFGCAAAFAAAPLVMASPAAAKDCPWGTVPRSTGCAPRVRRAASARQAWSCPRSGAAGAVVVNNPNGYGSVNGIPCTQEHMGTCIGMIQSQG